MPVTEPEQLGPARYNRRATTEDSSWVGPLVGLGVAGIFGVTMLAGGSAKAAGPKKPKPSSDNPSPPDNGPRPDKPPTPEEDLPPANIPPGQLLERYPGLQMVDLRGKASKTLILRQRTLLEVTAVVIHQTGFFGWKPSNPNWAKIHAHFVVRRSGDVVINYNPEDRMSTGSNNANKFCVTIEHEGNYPNASGNFYKPEKFGKSYLQDAPNQVRASRRLVTILHELCPKMTAIFAHRQWTAERQNCPGPDLWKAVGEWAVDNLNLTDGGAGWQYGSGLPIPEDWRLPPGTSPPLA